MPPFVRSFNILSRCVAMWRCQHLEGVSLKGCHHSYVYALCRNPGLSQDELAQRLFINKSNVTRHLSFLEEQGYVKREADPVDRRVTKVYPTEKMRSLLPKMREVTEEFKAAVSQGIPEEDMEVFLRVLDRMSQNAASNVQYGEDGE